MNNNRTFVLLCWIPIIALSVIPALGNAQSNVNSLWLNTTINPNVVANAGDINNDGFDDLVGGNSGFKQPGAVYLISGLDGSLLRTIIGDQPRLGLGHSVDGIGDINGDSVPDIVTGAIAKQHQLQ